MTVLQNLYLAFRMMEIINEPLVLGVLNIVWL
jgi:hypothetical protein